MPPPCVTLTTDFGAGSVYVAAVKGVLLSLNPQLSIVDLTHDIAPQNIDQASFFLAGSVPFFPRSAIHLVVVDPEVGTNRALLCIDLDGRILVGPDTGFWCELGRVLGASPRVYRIDEERLRRPGCSATFHGRDILAPAAARLSLGHPPESMGVVASTWRGRERERAQVTEGAIQGKVLFVDRFGNLITNITPEDLQQLRGPWLAEIGGKVIATHLRTYGEASDGALITLISSFNLFEIAVRNGNAELFLSCGVGSGIIVRAGSLPQPAKSQ